MFLIKTLIILTLLAPALSQSAIYKCKDKSGSLIFSQVKCGADAKNIKVRPNYEPQPVVASKEAKANSNNREMPPPYTSSLHREKTNIARTLFSYRMKGGFKRPDARKLLKRQWEIEEIWHQEKFYHYELNGNKRTVLCRFYKRRAEELKQGIADRYLLDVDITKYSKQYANGISKNCLN
tara:strand:- start:13923 stop:14462 length:540 start_codon:yes stop_codon:yes gene_type:complete